MSTPTPKKNALIVTGGWDGHTPKKCADLFAPLLEKAGFTVKVSDTLDAYLDADYLKEVALIVPIWTMDTISHDQWNGLNQAVQNGAGLAGFHGGMIDAFRNNNEYQWMTGAQWVAHPGDCIERYTVEICDDDSPHHRRPRRLRAPRHRAVLLPPRSRQQRALRNHLRPVPRRPVALPPGRRDALRLHQNLGQRPRILRRLGPHDQQTSTNPPPARLCGAGCCGRRRTERFFAGQVTHVPVFWEGEAPAEPPPRPRLGSSLAPPVNHRRSEVGGYCDRWAGCGRSKAVGSLRSRVDELGIGLPAWSREDQARLPTGGTEIG